MPCWVGGYRSGGRGRLCTRTRSAAHSRTARSPPPPFRTSRRQVAREISIHSSLEHRNIIQLWAAFEDEYGEQRPSSEGRLRRARGTGPSPNTSAAWHTLQVYTSSSSMPPRAMCSQRSSAAAGNTMRWRPYGWCVAWRAVEASCNWGRAMTAQRMSNARARLRCTTGRISGMRKQPQPQAQSRYTARASGAGARALP
jgi:hypothetical protein